MGERGEGSGGKGGGKWGLPTPLSTPSTLGIRTSRCLTMLVLKFEQVQFTTLCFV